MNRAWIPTGAQLLGETAAASQLAGEEALASSDLTDAVPSMVGVDSNLAASNEVATGVLHIAVPFDERILLSVDGVPIEGRPGFGITTAFDVSTPGVGVIGYERDASRTWWLTSQAILWLALLIVAAGARSPFGRRRATDFQDETLIDLTETPDLALGVAGEALGLTFGDSTEHEEVELHYGFGEGLFEPIEDITAPRFRGPPVDLVDPKGLPVVTPLQAEVVPDDDEVDLAALVSSVDQPLEEEADPLDEAEAESGGDDQ